MAEASLEYHAFGLPKLSVIWSPDAAHLHRFGDFLRKIPGTTLSKNMFRLAIDDFAMFGYCGSLFVLPFVGIPMSFA